MTFREMKDVISEFDSSLSGQYNGWAPAPSLPLSAASYTLGGGLAMVSAIIRT